MRFSRFLIALFVLALIVIHHLTAARAEPPGDLNDLSMEVNALQTLFHLELTPAQMERLAGLARNTADRHERQPARTVSAALKKTLGEMHEALVQRDGKKVPALAEKLEGLFTRSSPELDDHIVITEAARKKAPQVVKMLNPRQAAAFLTHYASDWHGPLTRLIDGVENTRKLSPDEWKMARSDIADDVVWLVVGADLDRAQALKPKVTGLLDQARAIPEKEWKKKKSTIEEAARALIGDVGPVRMLQNAMERDLAELLANPRLPRALEARQAALGKPAR
jgi:hypothetical protein